MDAKVLFKEYQQQVMGNLQGFHTGLAVAKEEVEKSPAKYKGEPVEFLYQPMWHTQEDMDRYDSLINTLMEILNKVVDRYLEDPAFRKAFGFSPLLEKLILKDPGYSCNIPMGRFDIFYHYSNEFQFCELNADGSSGMVEQRELQRILGDSPMLAPFIDKYQLRGFELFDSWVQALIKNYQEFSKGTELPRVAIVDFLKGAPPSEFVEFQKAFEKAGCPTVIVDARGLTYREGKLYAGDFAIDCVYRRAVTWELVEHAEEVKPFLDAYLAGDVCVVGPIRSQVIHNKQVFAILHDETLTPFLTAEERAFVKAHIPYTRIFNHQDEALVAYAVEHQQKLVLKPMDKYASHGVRVGADYTPQEWLEMIHGEAKEEYLLQEFCRVPQIPMARVEGGQVAFIPHNYIIGLFVYNGKLQGLYTRTGTKNIIGSIVECYTVPNYYIREK